MSDDEGLSESTWQTLEPNQSHTQPDLRDAWYRCSCWWMTNWQVEIYPQCFLLCRSILHTCDYMAADWLHPPSAKFLLPLPNLSSLRLASPHSTQPLLPPPNLPSLLLYFPIPHSFSSLIFTTDEFIFGSLLMLNQLLPSWEFSSH